MPPKKKKRKIKQPTQRQSQKQVVNITFADKKNKRRKRRPVKKDNLQMAVQTLSSNLNMFSSDTARLNNLENLITELRREQRQPITSGIIKPITTPTPTPVPTPAPKINVPINVPIASSVMPEPVSTPILKKPINPAPLPVEKEEGDLADLLNPIRPFVRVSGEQKPIQKLKLQLKKKQKKQAKKSAELPRPNTTEEPVEDGGVDVEIPLKKPRKERKEDIRNIRKNKADELRKTLLLRKGIQGLSLTADQKDREQYEKIVNKMSDMTETDEADKIKVAQALKYIVNVGEEEAAQLV